MATFCPATKQTSSLTPSLALAMLVPAVILFCAVYESVELDGVATNDCCQPVALKTGLVVYECGVRPTFLPERQGPVSLVRQQSEFTSSSGAQCVQQQLFPEPAQIGVFESAPTRTLVQQQAEQNTSAVAQNVQSQIWPDFGAYEGVSADMSVHWGESVAENLCGHLGPILLEFLSAVLVPLLLAIGGVITLSWALAFSCQFRRF